MKLTLMPIFVISVTRQFGEESVWSACRTGKTDFRIVSVQREKLVSAIAEITVFGGRYWVRTSDPCRVKAGNEDLFG